MSRLKNDPLVGRLFRGASSVFLISVLGLGIAFLNQIFLARILGTHHYGIYVYVLTWVGLLVLPCKLGLDTAVVRFVSAYRAQARWPLLRGMLHRTTMLLLGTSLLVGGLAAVFVFYADTDSLEGLTVPFLVGFTLIPILTLSALRQSALMALKHVALAALPENVVRPLLLGVLVILVFLLDAALLNSTTALGLNLFSATAAFLLGNLWLRRRLPRKACDSRTEYSTREWLSVGFPLLFVSAMHLLLGQTDILMLGFLLSPEHAGIYSVAARISTLTSFGLQAFNSIGAPMISELHATNRAAELQRLLTIAARGIILVTLAIAVTTSLLSKPILSLFGEGFAPALVPLLVLLTGQIANAFFGPVGFLMAMTGHQKESAKILGFSALANIALNATLIPAFGLLGASIATVGATLLWNLLMYAYVLRRLNLNPAAIRFKSYEKT